jgi:hypothetical protein
MFADHIEVKEFDGEKRQIHVVLTRPLDLQPIPFLMDFCFIKKLAAEIIGQESSEQLQHDAMAKARNPLAGAKPHTVALLCLKRGCAELLHAEADEEMTAIRNRQATSERPRGDGGKL